MRRRSFLFGAAATLASRVNAAGPFPVEMKTLTYAKRGSLELLLDLYLPQGAGAQLPVIVFLHGGGWQGGTRTTGPDFKRYFAQDGFAVAAIEYRLSPSVRFPSNVEDVKTSIRWIRANAAVHGLGTNIGLWGTSAGGHLAAMAGLTPAGVFEGEGNREQSSAVDCVLDAYGPSFFLVMDAQTAEEKRTLQPVAAALNTNDKGGAPPALVHDAANSAESSLLGAPIERIPDLVRAASTLTYAHSGAPPFLLMHGLADNSVPHQQSVLLYEALVAAGNEATLRLVDGLPHTFYNRTNLDDVAGPFRMDVREHPKNGTETHREDRAKVFDVARDFFRKHLD